jgi:hypothetical protein
LLELGTAPAVDRRAQVPDRVVQAACRRGCYPERVPDRAADHDDTCATAHEQVGVGQQQPVDLTGPLPVIELFCGFIK